MKLTPCFAVLSAAAMAALALAVPRAQEPATAVEALHFHHVHLNSTDPKAAAASYPKPFALSAAATTFNGFEAVKTGNVYILFTKVAATPQNELTGPQTSVWHFGWNTPDSRKYDENFRKMGLTIAQMWDAADGKLVDMSSDTLPGLPTQEQILEMRAKGTQPTRQGGFGYLRGPDGAMIENAQAGTTERFNHVHMYHEHPECAMRWYVEHLGAKRPAGRGGAAAPSTGSGQVPEAAGDCHTKTYAPPTWPSFARTGFVRNPAGGVTFDDISISIRPWPGGGLVSTRGTIYDHWALSTANLDATVARLKRENVKFLEEVHPWGNSRAAMIEGPDRIAIELVDQMTVLKLLGVLAILAALGGSLAAQNPIVGPPIVPLEESYLRWPLPASAAAYGKIDGDHLKIYVEQLGAISRKSRDAGQQWWGRITGTPAHAEAQQLVASKLRSLGMDVRLEETALPPAWFPTSWAVSAASGPNTVALKTAHPVLRSIGTPASGLDLDAVYVGLGTPSDFAGRDVRGKAVVIYSIPTPSALNHSGKTNGAMLLAEQKGAAAVIIVLGIPGNFATQLWGSGGEGPDLTKVPWFSVGNDDGAALRELIDNGAPVKIRMRLAIEHRSLRPSAVFGVLPGTTDENILVIAHTDGFWEAAVDNASGVAAMLGLAEHFAAIPKAQRRRTITFMAPIGHHVTPDLSLQKLHDNRATVFAKTALIINAEHVTTTQTYLYATQLRKSNAATAHRFFVGRSHRLAQILVDNFTLFGVALYELPSTRFGVAGDLVKLVEDAPGIEVIESNAFYHSDEDKPAIVPAAGLESITRAYAKIIDDINKLDLKDIVDAPAPLDGARGRPATAAK